MQLIILDRDGVINFDSHEYIKSPLEWIPIPGSLEAIAKLTQQGFSIAVTTNQSGVGRGLYDLKMLALIHEKMLNAVRALGGDIAAIFYCPHIPEDYCDCRKPKPGLLLQVRDYFQCDLKNVWAVGDSKRDLEAAAQVGCQPVLVKTGNGAELFSKMGPVAAAPRRAHKLRAPGSPPARHPFLTLEAKLKYESREEFLPKEIFVFDDLWAVANYLSK